MCWPLAAAMVVLLSAVVFVAIRDRNKRALERELRFRRMAHRFPPTRRTVAAASFHRPSASTDHRWTVSEIEKRIHPALGVRRTRIADTASTTPIPVLTVLGTSASRVAGAVEEEVERDRQPAASRETR